MSEHDQNYCAPWQVALRKAPGAALCSDEDCGLSDGYAHVGPCEPCDCGKRHAIDECPVQRGMALTPSEVALAKVLAAWQAWPGADDSHGADDAMSDVNGALIKHGLTWHESITDAGHALLERARNAGVL